MKRRRVVKYLLYFCSPKQRGYAGRTRREDAGIETEKLIGNCSLKKWNDVANKQLENFFWRAKRISREQTNKQPFLRK